MRKKIVKQLDPFVAILGALVVIGLVLQLTVRDGILWIAAAYYALPLPLIVVASVALSLWWKFRKKPRWSVVFILVTTLSVVLWMSRNRPDGDDLSTAGTDSISVGFWNAARTEHPIKPLVEWLGDSELEVLALVEAPPLSAANEKQYRRALPAWQIASLPGGRVVFWRGDRGDVSRIEWNKLPNRSSVASTACRLTAGDGKEIRLVIADVGPNPFYPRGDILDTILKTAGNDPATVVVGDFNTPVESVHFNRWRTQFSHGATQGGIGYRETWPWFAPVLCIDHLWFSKDFSVRSARRKNFFCSDHSMVIVEVGF